MKVFLSFFVLILVLSSCGKEEIVSENGKQDFLVETKLWEDFEGGITLEKSGVVSSSQDIALSSQAS